VLNGISQVTTNFYFDRGIQICGGNVGEILLPCLNKAIVELITTEYVIVLEWISNLLDQVATLRQLSCGQLISENWLFIDIFVVECMTFIRARSKDDNNASVFIIKLK
jgi:hypothetical protein